MKRLFGNVLDKGLVTLPAAWRKEAGIETGDRLAFDFEGDSMRITVVKEYPTRTYEAADIQRFILQDASDTTDEVREWAELQLVHDQESQ